MGRDISTQTWDRVLSTVLSMPGAKVDRESFLRSALQNYASTREIEEAIKLGPATAGISKETIKRVSNNSIRWHKTGVTAVSAISGIPGKWWLAATIPADITQFFYHVVIIAQKLAYLHGWPELMGPEEGYDDEGRQIITVFIGSMFGAHSAQKAVHQAAEKIAKTAVTRLPKVPLTKYAIYNISKKIAKWLGVRLTKKKFAEWAGRAIPLVGGMVAGTVTFFAFAQACKKLQSDLEKMPLADRVVNVCGDNHWPQPFLAPTPSEWATG
ncbi:hypothetical protein CKO15_13110 [Halorhodospira abdelmalekii]|uniref:hypothetical protein n=1 Tax=Halorhodospira abdelmalekii TaxID=421629 RepID=UPI001903E2AA|nr:hypothetical protein [Halorhodospira abdelmalekii]MBK1736191.1 hypothetical protein [Halorhodospira abdelmalekii]